MEVSVVTKRDDDEGYERRTVVGVFTVYAQAMAYCDKVDPLSETHDVDKYELNILLETPNK